MSSNASMPSPSFVYLHSQQILVPKMHRRHCTDQSTNQFKSSVAAMASMSQWDPYGIHQTLFYATWKHRITAEVITTAESTVRHIWYSLDLIDQIILSLYVTGNMPVILTWPLDFTMVPYISGDQFYTKSTAFRVWFWMSHGKDTMDNTLQRTCVIFHSGMINIILKSKFSIGGYILYKVVLMTKKLVFTIHVMQNLPIIRPMPINRPKAAQHNELIT